jgi:hypothetical protein
VGKRLQVATEDTERMARASTTADLA